MAIPNRPAKAIQDWLAEAGFGRDDYNYYQRGSALGPLVEIIYFAKEQDGLEVHIGVAYFSDEVDGGGAVVSPPEYGALHADGTLGLQVGRCAIPGRPREIVSLLASELDSAFATLSEPGIMLELYRYLMGEVEAPPEPFATLPDYLERKVTRNRLLCAAAYNNLAARFDRAVECLKKIPDRLFGEDDGKILRDAEQGRITIPDVALGYLDEIGARPPRIDGV